MSAKWIRSKKWDDENIPAWAWPIKFLLRAFSSIPLAVVLLSFVIVYCILASVPIGLIVLGLTTLTYAASAVLAAALVGLVPVFIMRRLWKRPGNARFLATVLGLIVLCAAGFEAWYVFIWPHLHFDPATGSGVRFFAEFVDQYRGTTLRRLPGFEMSEPEFYSWWPLRLVLMLFVINMVVATVRRIEFSFPNIGVLTVHTGIVTIALGSVYYRGLKIEGDTVLFAGQPDADGNPSIGPIQDRFFDNQSTALWINQNSTVWDQRPIHPPRYNDYGLRAAGFPTTRSVVTGRDMDSGREFSGAVPQGRPLPGGGSVVDPDLRFRVVGYAQYCQPVTDWVKADAPKDGKTNPVRFLDMNVTIGGTADSPRESTYRFFLLPEYPAGRSSDVGSALTLEWMRQMPESRWKSVTESLPAGQLHGICVEVPGSHFRGTFAIEKNAKVVVEGTGYTIEVKDLADRPPFPIITEGYRSANSSVAVLRITGPDGKSFDRYVYSKFPEISQDLLDELNERGMPKRRNADPGIAINYIDGSKISVVLDEQADGRVRAAIRSAGSVRTVTDLKAGSVINEAVPRSKPEDPRIDLVLGERWEHAEAIERPMIVPPSQRDNADIGTHSKSMLAVEVSAEGKTWKKTVWLPFTRFQNVETDKHREVELPDGRTITMAFGRLAHAFPRFFLQLANFEMIAYDHRGSPRDYQSIIRVVPTHDANDQVAFKMYEHVTRLNAPLQAPFMWSDARSYVANVFGTLRSRLDPRQFKLSQAGWDAEGWRRTQEMTDRGELKRPMASFTILGVGNNPGIHIVALGGVLMSIGIPWAFYIKPLILQRRKKKLQAAVASGSYKKPEPARPSELQGAPT